MVDLSRVKVALFDFDDTLCIHRKADNFGIESYNVAMVKGRVSYWDEMHSQPNKQMRVFMDKLSVNNVELGLISATSFMCTAVNKIEWVKLKYGRTLKNYCTGDFDSKVQIIKALITADNLSPDEVLFVDDLYSNVDAVAELGVQVATPMEVVNYINNLN